jgi:hypothetical protein
MDRRQRRHIHPSRSHPILHPGVRRVVDLRAGASANRSVPMSPVSRSHCRGSVLVHGDVHPERRRGHDDPRWWRQLCWRRGREDDRRRSSGPQGGPRQAVVVQHQPGGPLPGPTPINPLRLNGTTKYLPSHTNRLLVLGRVTIRDGRSSSATGSSRLRSVTCHHRARVIGPLPAVDNSRATRRARRAHIDWLEGTS